MSVATISRWKAADKRGGVDWDSLRAERARKDPHALLAILEDRRDSLARTDPGSEYGGYADALYKLQRVISAVRAEFRDVSTALAVLEDLARRLAPSLPADDLAVVRRAIEAYLDDLKRESLA